MSLEVEIKYLNADLMALHKKLHALGGQWQACNFERNAVLKSSGKELLQQGILLRLRSDEDNVITLKTPAIGHDGLKVRHEYETTFGDFGTMMTIFETLGYSVAFWYEKLRETWQFMDCHICLDHLPFGDVVEIEGEADAIFAAAKALGVDSLKSSDESYHALNLAWRKEKGLAPEDGFVFDETERKSLLEQAKNIQEIMRRDA
ncbi:class IV adenylate cyclase [Desulfobaculum bizertense]|uniref:Adenylate cyclase, class 2 n=1 Tax=Desulfobaculum bizertense DSM 18034 TaxID=1121442 RepID=A0A1T4WWD5_9BACT|nr:class IV adenylate cyclase [Desulfobaculum bizertense]SKA81559.1 adenylate cyclase, class 2 [Desulfobaculum bizertense DSM 18034]